MTKSLDPDRRSRLLQGLSLICAAQAVLAALKVCRLDANEAVETTGWVARSLVDWMLTAPAT